MDALIDLLSSGPFWSAVGAIAGVGGILVTLRKRKAVTTEVIRGEMVDELPDEKAFVESQVAAMTAANVAVELCLHTVHSSGANWKAQRVNASLVEAKRRGLTVRVLTGAGQEQLAGAYELQEIHQVDVRLNPELLHSDLRFLKTDAAEILLGIADQNRAQRVYSPSHSWATLKTIALADTLEREFQRLWISPASKSLYEFCNDYVAPLRDRISAEKLALDLGLKDPSFLAQFYGRSPLTEIMRRYTFIFHGKSGAGKSTLIRKLTQKYWVRHLDLENFVLPRVFRYGNENVVGERIQQMYAELVAHVGEVSYDLIETGSDFSGSVLPALFQSIQGHGKIPVVVHCEMPLSEALRRNAARVRPVPINVLQSQNAEEEIGTFKTICHEGNIKIIELPPQTLLASVDTFSAAVRTMHLS